MDKISRGKHLGLATLSWENDALEFVVDYIRTYHCRLQPKNVEEVLSSIGYEFRHEEVTFLKRFVSFVR